LFISWLGRLCSRCSRRVCRAHCLQISGCSIESGALPSNLYELSVTLWPSCTVSLSIPIHWHTFVYWKGGKERGIVWICHTVTAIVHRYVSSQTRNRLCAAEPREKLEHVLLGYVQMGGRIRRRWGQDGWRGQSCWYL